MFATLIASMGMFAKTLYLVPNSNWLTDGARFAVYAYDDSNSTNAWYAMTAVEGETNVYSATVDDKYPNVIFCRMNGSTTENSWSNKWSQTNDLTVVSDKDLYTIADGAWDKGDGAWSVYTKASDTGDDDDDDPVVSTVAIKFYASWSTVYAYVWEGESTALNGAWPGGKLTVGSDGWYKAEIKSGTNIIFSNGSEQTTDITNQTADACYVLSSEKNSDGHIYPQKDSECKAKEVVIEEMVYTIVGDPVLVGSSWNLNDAANEMVKGEDGYTLVKTGVSLVVGEYKYKVVGNHDWDVFQLPASGDNILKIEADGTYDVTFTFNGSDKLNATAEKKSDDVVISYYIAGTMNNWNPAGDKLVDGSYTYKDMAVGTYQFKITKGNWTWEANYENVDTECSTATLYTEENGNNIYFTITEVQDVTISYDAETNKVCVKAVTGVLPDTYVIAGDIEILNGEDAWAGDAEANLMTLVDDVYTLVVEGKVLAAKTYKFKVVKNGGTWIPDGIDNNSELVIAEAGKYNITYTYKVGDERAAATAEKVEDIVIKTGFGLLVDENEIALVQNPDNAENPYSLMAKDVEVTATSVLQLIDYSNDVKFGVAVLGGAAAADFEIDGATVKAKVAGTYHFYVELRSDEQGGNGLYVEKAGEPSGIEETTVLDVNAPMYNIMGMQVNENYRGIIIQNGKKFMNF